MIFVRESIFTQPAKGMTDIIKSSIRLVFKRQEWWWIRFYCLSKYYIFMLTVPLQETRSARNCDTTYLELVGSLVNTLVSRLILFYKRQPDDQLLFRQALQQLQDNISYYEQFKPPSIKYSHLLEPLISHLRANTIKQYFANDVISEVPEKQSQIEQTTKSTKRRIYSSNHSLDVHRNSHWVGTVTSSTSIRNQWGPWGEQRLGNLSTYLPDVEERKSSQGVRRKGRSLKSHNYEKQVTKAYDKIIGATLNAKPFKRRKYQNKIENIVKMNDYPEYLE